MEHDAECEGNSIMLHVVEYGGFKLSMEQRRFVVDEFCFCSLRRTRNPRPDEIARVGRFAVLWARLVWNGDPDWQRAKDNAIAVGLGHMTLSEVGLDLPEEVVEVDFRKRARVKR